MADVFVSYTHADREKVRHIVEVLEREGFTVWWDTRLRAGEQWDEVIETPSRALAASWWFGAFSRLTDVGSGQRHTSDWGEAYSFP